MDTLTHGLGGALIGKALSSRIKKVRTKTFMLVGFWAAIFPDFDFLFNLLPGDSYLLNHRGITHSFILMPLWAYLIAWLNALIFKHKIFFSNNWIDENATIKELVKEFYILSIIGIASHILADIITQYGTMFLSPFSRHRFDMGSVFVIDLWFSGIIILGLLVSWIIKKHQYIIAGIFILFVTLYIGYTYTLKIEAENIAIDYLQAHHLSKDNLIIYSSPRPVSPKNWTISAYDKTTQIYHVADFSLDENKKLRMDFRNQNFISLMNNSFASYKETIWIEIPKWGINDEEKLLAHKIWDEPAFENYRWFYSIPVFDSMSKNNEKTCGYFRDLRFQGVGREPGTPFVYGICYLKNGEKYKAQLKNGKEVKSSLS